MAVEVHVDAPQVLNVLELERLFNERYFEPSMDVPTFYRQACRARPCSARMHRTCGRHRRVKTARHNARACVARARA